MKSSKTKIIQNSQGGLITSNTVVMHKANIYKLPW